jgi:hypothetical protein
MIQQATEKFSYTLGTITRNAPVVSGVYTLFGRGECLYVGESDDICASLLEHYYNYNPCLNDKEITHFTFDLVPSNVRGALLIDRIRQLDPNCTPRAGSPRCPHCRSAQIPAFRTPLAMAAIAHV